ncbi:MAG: fumarylacetoacetate hydrolase family protein [Spirochaetia bacterium]|nr:fumarylacetoacetate hydrolase family protein [Spirochaetia bacterium]
MEIVLHGKSATVQRIFCVGMNYLDHVKELNNKIPEKPVIFMKPASSLIASGKNPRFPSHGSNLHYETELVLLIGKGGHVKQESDAIRFISGLTIGFDLTLRDLQNNLRQNGHPWEISKAFDDSAPIGNFLEFKSGVDLNNIEFSGFVNGEMRQKGNSSEMIFPIEKLVSCIGSIWDFLPGDIIFTGTPPGVGILKKGDTFSARFSLSNEEFSWQFQ